MSGTDGTATVNGGPGRKFFVDVTAPSAARHGFGTFRSGWEAQVGEGFPLPVFDPGADGGFRVTVHASKAGDTVIADLYSETFRGRTGGARDHFQDRALTHVLQRGRWHFARPDERGHLTAPAGSSSSGTTARPRGSSYCRTQGRRC
ncbi:hypothetical protein [Streptomyces puniciscabiei]|uniref:hypothetical protein n=1 Tax=Streptomyces puniciscabiei TaxID=164348 RepID=UPI00332E5BE3